MKQKEYLLLGGIMIFYEGVISMSVGYCTVLIYKKYKPDKYIVDFSPWQMPSIISSIILMFAKVVMQQTLTSTHNYTAYPPQRKLFIILYSRVGL